MKEVSLIKKNESNKETLKELEHIKNKGKYIISLAVVNVLLSLILALVLVIYVFPGKFALMNDNSMLPSFKKNNVVYTFPKDLKDVQIGNVISFYSENKDVVVHRVVEKFNNNGEIYLRARGDENSSVDSEIISNNNYIGEVKAVLPVWVGSMLFKGENGEIDILSYSIFFGTVTFMLIVLDILIFFKKMR